MIFSIRNPDQARAAIEIALSRITALPKFSKARTRFLRGRDNFGVEIVPRSIPDHPDAALAGVFVRKGISGKEQISLTTYKLKFPDSNELDVKFVDQDLNSMLKAGHETIHVAQSYNEDTIDSPEIPYRNRSQEIEAYGLETISSEFIKTVLHYDSSILNTDSKLIRAQKLLEVTKRIKRSILASQETYDSDGEVNDSQNDILRLDHLDTQIRTLQVRIESLERIEREQVEEGTDL